MRLGGRDQRSENREQRTENREQRTENREQRTENRDQRQVVGQFEGYGLQPVHQSSKMDAGFSPGLNGTAFTGYGKTRWWKSFVTGHDFSRAVNAAK
jgi:hypothetical protein